MSEADRLAALEAKIQPARGDGEPLVSFIAVNLGEMDLLVELWAKLDDGEDLSRSDLATARRLREKVRIVEVSALPAHVALLREILEAWPGGGSLENAGLLIAIEQDLASMHGRVSADVAPSLRTCSRLAEKIRLTPRSAPEPEPMPEPPEPLPSTADVSVPEEPAPPPAPRRSSVLDQLIRDTQRETLYDPLWRWR
jgi:hypothetical protein